MANLEITRAQRLDQYVIEAYPQMSRAYAKKLCDEDHVLVNGQPEKAGYKLRAKDEVTIDYDPTHLEVIPEIDLPILYEDEECLVINKPAGVLTHSKGGFEPEGSVATFIRGRTKAMSGERAGVVHRLDRATSGVIICAKTPEALSWLQKQFSQRKVKKTYQAIIAGHLTPQEAIIDMPIERNPKAPSTFRVGENGKSATTHYKVLESTKGYDRVELYPTTGRTHQLRVHMKQVGHPIVGDFVYGGEPAKRLFLHALSLELTLPNRERKVFNAPLPDEFMKHMSKNSG